MSDPKLEEYIFTREEFYQKVWSAPATKIASELGCSDVLISKVCKAHDIPKPPPGYWAKVAHGKRVSRKPLPQNLDPSLQTFRFVRDLSGNDRSSEPEPEFESDIRQMLERACSMEPITVPEALRHPHPLITTLREWWAYWRIPFDKRDRRQSDQFDLRLNVSVGDAQEGRALRIMDALIKRVELIGGSVEVRKARNQLWKTETVVKFGGEDAAVIRLREKVNQIKIPPEKRDRFWNSKYERKMSGLLILDRGSAEFDRVFLRDTPKKKCIEDGLNDLIIGFIREAGRARISRRWREESDRRHAEERRLRLEEEKRLQLLRDELEARQKVERAKVEELFEHASAWKQAREIREYLSALRAEFAERDGTIHPESDVSEYLAWGQLQADRLDPLRAYPNNSPAC